MAYAFDDLNILVIEDDQYMRMLIKDLLNAFGAGTVRTAKDGGSAYETLRHFPADIVIVDWLMRPVNGLEFLKQVRNAVDSPNAYVPAIMLTAFTEVERVKECRDAGITEFLAKPIKPQTLYDRIARIIKDQRQFVRSETYFGPDRRRADRPFAGLDRRASGTEIDLDETGWTMSTTSATDAASQHSTR